LFPNLSKELFSFKLENFSAFSAINLMDVIICFAIQTRPFDALSFYFKAAARD